MQSIAIAHLGRCTEHPVWQGRAKSQFYTGARGVEAGEASNNGLNPGIIAQGDEMPCCGKL